MNSYLQVTFIAIVICGILISCKKTFVEGYDIDPNRAVDVSMDVLLSSAEAYTLYVSSSDLPRYANVISQQMTLVFPAM